jgi:hypothetical protein
MSVNAPGRSMKDNENVSAILTQIAYELAIQSMEGESGRASLLTTVHSRARHVLSDIMTTYGKAYGMVSKVGDKKPADASAPPRLDLMLVGQCSACGKRGKVTYSRLRAGTIRCECGSGEISVPTEDIKRAETELKSRLAAG